MCIISGISIAQIAILRKALEELEASGFLDERTQSFHELLDAFVFFLPFLGSVVEDVRR